MAKPSTALQQALDKLDNEFRCHSFRGTPPELQQLLLTSKGEGNAGRKALYKRLFCLLWFGSGKSVGRDQARGRGPTYVFPDALKAVVRARFSADVRRWEDPKGPQVYHVTYKDLAQAKWPKK